MLFGGQRLAPRAPWGLIVLVGGLVASAAADLQARGVNVVGPVPRGLPTPGVPSIQAGDLAALVGAGAALAFVGLAEGLSAARLFAGRGATGSTPTRSFSRPARPTSRPGLFGGIGVAGSLSKTAAVYDARGRTQMAGLVAAALSLIVIALIAPVLSGLPRAVLSAIVVNAVWRLMDLPALFRYARVRRNDIVAALVAAVGVLAFGPLYGLLLAVAGSVLGLVYRSSRLDVEVMGRVPEEKAAWGSTRNHQERRTYPGVVVLRLSGPVFWVTATPVHDAVLADVESVPGTLAVVLDLEATDQMDTTSADVLADLLGTLRERGIDLYLVRVRWDVRKVLRRSGFMAELGEDHVWHSISQGVREARRAHALTHLPAPDGRPGPGDVATDERPGEEVAEEHIVARSADSIDPEQPEKAPG